MIFAVQVELEETQYQKPIPSGGCSDTSDYDSYLIKRFVEVSVKKLDCVVPFLPEEYLRGVRICNLREDGIKKKKKAMDLYRYTKYF